MGGSDVKRASRSLTAGVGLALLIWVAAPAVATAARSARTARAGSARTARAVPASRRLQLVLPLVARDSGLSAFASAVTTPGSPRYGDYRSIQWLARRFGASSATRSRVVAYLRHVGASHIRLDATGLFVDAKLPAGTAQRLFSTTLGDYRSGRSAYTAPTAGVSIPRGLRGLVTGVVGLDTQAIAAVPSSTRHTGSGGASPGPGSASPDQATTTSSSAYSPETGAPSGCAAGVAAGGFTPNQYLTAYGYNSLQAAHTLGQGERVALIEIDGYRPSDIATFAHCFGLHEPKIAAFSAGVSHPLQPGGESTLDLEVLTAAAPYLQSIDVYESQPQASSVLLALTQPLQTPGFKPQVISASLGLCESQTIDAVGNAGVKASEAALEEASASGISVLAASGDYGSADCVNSSGANALPEPQLAVNYPASSPWVTAVGGTNLALTPQNTILSQVVWNDASAIPGASGGGGFSQLFQRPSYQGKTVASNRRALPDVALLADIAPGYDVYCTAAPDCVNSTDTSPWQTVGGTSAATPLLAGGFALIDELLRGRQLDGLGLANPLLYEIGRNPAQAPSVFDDVTVGSNDVGPFIQASLEPLGCCAAATGFDEASGWGGVNVAGLAQVALSTERPLVNVGVSVNPAQRPYTAHGVFARVSCSGACLMGALATIRIGRGKPFTDFSNLYHLAKAGRKLVKVTFRAGQLKQLKAALAKHTEATVAVAGAIVDAGGNVERRTASTTLRIEP